MTVVVPRLAVVVATLGIQAATMGFGIRAGKQEQHSRQYIAQNHGVRITSLYKSPMTYHPKTTLPWLEPHQPFPPVEQALQDDTPWPGLLAAGGVLDADTLEQAYRQGIFPWYSDNQPILWWSTDPRMVLRPDNFRLHRSLRKTIQRFAASPQCEIRIDTQFADVMRACAGPRAHQSGTWITDDVLDAYTALHRRGLAHSVETWVDGTLVGGLYCVALGRAVYGESMFTRVPDASKIALAALVALSRTHGVEMIDCQQETAHLASLGASAIAREVFVESIAQAQQKPAMQWQFSARLWGSLLQKIQQ